MEVGFYSQEKEVGSSSHPFGENLKESGFNRRKLVLMVSLKE